MRIGNNYSPNFGLKIVKNDDLKKIIDFQLREKRCPKDVIKTGFDRVQKSYNDDLSLEFKDTEIKVDPWFGPHTVSTYKFTGEMKASDSDTKYPVDYTSIHKYITDSPLVIPDEVKKFLKIIQHNVDAEDRKSEILNDLFREKKISQKALKYLASRRFVIDGTTVYPQKDGKFYMIGILNMGEDSPYYIRSSQPVNSTMLFTIEPFGGKMAKRNISLHGSSPEEIALEFAKKYSGKKLYNYKSEYLTTVPEFLKIKAK